MSPTPLFFVDKTPYGAHQMGHGDINTALPKNLRDLVDAEPSAMCLQDFVLVLPQCVDLGLLAVAAVFSAARHLKQILGSGTCRAVALRRRI